MIIQTGLCDGMVLQRTRDNTCDTAVAGTCAGAGRLVARVRRNGRIVPGFGARPIGHAARGRLEGRLRGLPAGGPYDIELALAGAPGAAPERAVIRNVRVGDLWILGGQSNMEGIGRLEDAAKPDPGVRAFYMNDVWAVARDPLHNLSQATDAIHHELGTARRPGIGTGPGVAFGQAMAQASGVPQGLIACAHGGSSMAQWDPALKRKGGGSLYGALLRRFRKNGGRVAGVVWYQGCSDTAPAQAALYTRRMRRLVRASRRDLNDPRLPWAIVQIAGVYNKGWNSAGWNSVQDQQRRLPETIPHCAVVPAIDLAFDDGIHISGKDQQRLGRRLAQAMRVLRGDRRAGRPPIALRSVRCANGRIVVTYNNVMGRLQTAGRPTGFLLADPHPASIIYRAELKGNRVILYPSVLETQRQSVSLYYGYGLAPYCNITDSADRSLPAMTWVNVEYQRYVMSPFVQTWQVSRLADPAGPLEDLAFPRRRKALGFSRRTFAGWFADLHPELSRHAQDKLVFCAARIACPERMKVDLCLAYDGPVKVWLDGRERLCDPKGTNPASQDKALVPASLAAGRHEILVALVSNDGKAWGVGCRFRRRIPATLRRRPQAWGAVPLPQPAG